MFGRRKIATLVAEFLGTGALTLLVLSVQRSTIGVPFFVAMAGGLTVALMIFTLGSTSGAHLNPAVTIGLWTVRKISTLNGLLYVVVQLLGAWGAYYLYTYFTNTLATGLQPIGGHFTTRVMVAELVGAAIFTLAWAAAVYQRFTTPVTATVAGLGYMLGVVAASSASIGLINPALALGVRAWEPSNWGTWGTYFLGPIVGAVIAFNLYNLLFTDDGFLKVRAAASASTTSSATVKKPAAKKKTATRSKKK